MRTLKIYETYSFREKDPIIDEARTAWKDSGHKLSYVTRVAGLSLTTPTGWFHGKTRSPQTAAVSAFMGALGYERRWVHSHRAVARAKKAEGKLNGKAKAK